MKRFIILFTILSIAFFVNAQSDKYNVAMTQQIALLDSAFQKNNFPDLGNKFERIGDAEKTQWLPYYYAAYCQVMNAYMEQDKSKVDAMADKADALITKAEALAGLENSETNVIRSMIASSRLMVDPPNRWMQYGQESANYIGKAKQLDSTNPRPVLLEAQSKFYTPEQFGGGKAIAAPVFEKAVSMFDGFKPASALHPQWGKASALYFLAQCK